MEKMISVERSKSAIREAVLREAYGKYQKLLDYYQINPKIQEAVWANMLKRAETDPGRVIGEITSYWEEAFGSNGKNKEVLTKTDPDLQKVLYQLRREGWQEHFRRKRGRKSR